MACPVSGYMFMCDWKSESWSDATRVRSQTMAMWMSPTNVFARSSSPL